MKRKYSFLIILTIFLIFLLIVIVQIFNAQVAKEKKEKARLEYEKKLPHIKLAYESCAKAIYDLTGRIAPKVGTPEFDKFIKSKSVKNFYHSKGFVPTNKFDFFNILEDSYGPSRFSGLYNRHYDYYDPNKKNYYPTDNYVYVVCNTYNSLNFESRKRFQKIQSLQFEIHAEEAHGYGRQRLEFIMDEPEYSWEKLKRALKKEL